jgi:PAS domain S-box-containing protein
MGVQLSAEAVAMKNYLRYLCALLAVGVILLLRYAMVPLTGYGIPYITLFPVTVGVALLAGMGPAIVTGLVGAIIIDYAFIEPLHTLKMDVAHISRVTVVVLTSAFVGYVGSVLRAARAKAEQQAQQLRESQEDLHRAQAVGSIGSWRLDVRRNELTWSDENYRIFGIPKGTPLTYETFLSAVHPDDREYVDTKWKAGMAGEDYAIEHRLVADGKIKWVREKAYIEFDKNNEPIGGFGITQDITKRKQAEEALRENELRERERTLELERLSSELANKNEELESIIRIASHDLRSPLMNIKGFSSELSKDIDKVHQMLKELPLPEKVGEKAETVFSKYVPEAVGFIQNSAEAINRMLKSLMAVAKAGTMPITVQRLDMNALVADIAANYQFRLIESGGTLAVEPLPHCCGDADQITQVFSNLIGNAIKYRDLSHPLHIRVHSSADKDFSTYCVEDNGKGIASEHHDKVFDLFARLDPEAAEGEGLGLTIAKRMIERQGGKIWVSSEIGKGSSFFVVMPR